MTDDPLTAHLEADLEVAQTTASDVDPQRSIDALGSSDTHIRRLAVQVLHTMAQADPIRVEPAVSALVGLLDDDDVTVRNLASRTVAEVADVAPDAVVPYVSEVAAALDDEYVHVQRYAVLALARLATTDPTATAATATSLGNLATHEIRLIGHSAITALASIADEHPDAVAPVAPTLLSVSAADTQHRPSQCRTSLPDVQFESVDDIEPHAAQERLVQTHNRQRAAATLAITTAGCPDAVAAALTPHVEQVHSLLHQNNPSGQVAAVGVLAYMAEDNPDVVHPVTDRLIELLEHSDRSIAGNAAWALHYENSPLAVDALEETSRTHTDAEIRTLCQSLLSEQQHVTERD